MAQRLFEPVKVLQNIEDPRLLAQNRPHADGVVPDNAGKHDRDGEFHGIIAHFVPDDNQKGRDERGVRARHTALLKEMTMPGTGPDFFHDVLRDFRKQENDERNEKEIGAEEIGERNHDKSIASHEGMRDWYIGDWGDNKIDKIKKNPNPS